MKLPITSDRLINFRKMRFTFMQHRKPTSVGTLAFGSGMV